MAENVIRFRKPIRLEPMSAYERLIIHSELANRDDVETESFGEEPRRRVVIRKKYSNLDIGKVGFGFNLIIVTVAAFIFGLPKALYTLISLFITSTILDKVLSGFTSKKLLLILTEKEEDIITYVIKDMNRGITSLMAEGGYTHNQKKLLYVAVTTSQMLSLKNKILRIDPKAFITIIDVSEVKGKGFQSI